MSGKGTESPPLTHLPPPSASVVLSLLLMYLLTAEFTSVMSMGQATPCTQLCNNNPTQPRPLQSSHPPQACLNSLAFEPAKTSSASRGDEADAAGSRPPAMDEPSQALAGPDALDSPPRPLDRSMGQLPSPPLLPTPPPKAGSTASRSTPGGSACIPLPALHPSVPPTSPAGPVTRTSDSHPPLWVQEPKDIRGIF